MACRTSGNRGGAPRARSLSVIVAANTGLITTLSKLGLLAPVTFAKTGGNSNLTLNTSTGGVSATVAIAVGASQTLTGTATGADGCVVPFTLVVTGGVTLAALTLSTSSIAENSAPGTIVGNIQHKSAGSALVLLSDAGGRFALNGTDQIVVGLGEIDYELATSHSITIRESLAGAVTGYRDTVLIITVTDVVETGPEPTLDPSLTPPSTTLAVGNTEVPIELLIDRGIIPINHWFQLIVARDEALTDRVINPPLVLSGTGAEIDFEGLEDLTADDGNENGELFLAVIRWNADRTHFGYPSTIIKWGDVTSPEVTIVGPTTAAEGSKMAVAFSVTESVVPTITGTDRDFIEVVGTQPGTSFIARLTSDADLDFESKATYDFNIVVTDLAGNSSLPVAIHYTVNNDPVDDTPTEWTSDYGVNKSYYATVSGTPKYTVTGLATGNPMLTRATNPANSNSMIVHVIDFASIGTRTYVGFDDGTADFNTAGYSPLPGYSDSSGVGLWIEDASIVTFYDGQLNAQYGSEFLVTDDIITINYDVIDEDTAEVKFYRTRSSVTIQLGTTIEVVPWVSTFAFAGHNGTNILTSNFAGY